MRTLKVQWWAPWWGKQCHRKASAAPQQHLPPNRGRPALSWVLGPPNSLLVPQFPQLQPSLNWGQD